MVVKILLRAFGVVVLVEDLELDFERLCDAERDDVDLELERLEAERDDERPRVATIAKWYPFDEGKRVAKMM